jgi:hypothetical protein
MPRKQFEQMYAKTGRPSIPPERLLKASLLVALYSVRSERLLCEALAAPAKPISQPVDCPLSFGQAASLEKSL